MGVWSSTQCCGEGLTTLNGDDGENGTALHGPPTTAGLKQLLRRSCGSNSSSSAGGNEDHHPLHWCVAADAEGHSQSLQRGRSLLHGSRSGGASTYSSGCSSASSGGAPRDDMWINGFRVLNTLGEGRLAKVRLCENAHGERFAMKIFRKHILARQRHWDAEGGVFRSALESVGEEIAIMKKLRHTNVVRLHRVIDDVKRSKLYLVMEYVTGGALLSGNAKLGPTSWRPIEEATARKLFRDVVCGLAYLHANGVVHQDIKPDNILLASDGRALIADFGVARLLGGPEARGATWRAELQDEISHLKKVLSVLSSDGTRDGSEGIRGGQPTVPEPPPPTVDGAAGPSSDRDAKCASTPSCESIQAPKSAPGTPAPVTPPSTLRGPAPPALAPALGGTSADASAPQSSQASPEASRAWAVAEARATIGRASTQMMLESSEGTPAFRAPETYEHGEHCGRRADIWSLGITLYVMLFGMLPFPWSNDTVASGADEAVKSVIVNTGGQQEEELQQQQLLLQQQQPPITTASRLPSVASSVGGSTISLGTPASTTRDALRVEHAVRTQPLSFPVGGDARVSSAARDLLSAMLMKDPGARPTLQTIAKDAWVTSMGDMPPVKLPAVIAPLRATPEEVHRAISLRSPGLDLATSSYYGSASTRGTSTLIESREQRHGSRGISRTKSEALRSQASLDFPFTGFGRF